MSKVITMVYKILILISLLLPTAVIANACKTINNVPSVTIPSVSICMDEYILMYNPKTKTPIYAMDVLTKTTVAKSSNIQRKDAFHAEKYLDESIRSTPTDYKNQNYDRGHVIPCDDMSTTKSQFQSFSMVNIVPQNPKNNRILWRRIETDTRNLTKKYNSITVISGPIYDNYDTKIGKHHVVVPTRLFKVVHINDNNKTTVYVVDNTDNSDINSTDIKSLETVVPIKFKF